MPAPDRIKQLVENFDLHKDQYKAANYNETQARIQFIDPFFSELGWDMNNKNGYAEAYCDVIHEDRVSVAGKSKSPDYSFRIGGMRKFFVEAKKPSVSIIDDKRPAFQLRRYGWSGKLPVSILTDFEEFAVYDCTIKPTEKDPASKARLKYYNYKEYIEKWDEIASLFSKDAILKGSFDRFADKKKRGTATVDTEFLTDIEKWRQSLASNILLNNDITPRQLNEAVQTTIDRIIFLRICEDRGIETYGKLEKLIKSKGNIYKELIKQFKDADDKYNSGLFHFNEKDVHATACDTLTPKLKIDDAPLKEILANLYFPNPYEFSVIPADILGQVYERFLGKVIEVEGRTVKIEEKPEVRKAGGVFYTPSYIVEYIVKNTVDKLLEDTPPTKAAKISVLDPACGSGSFLIVAYQHLLDWHLDYYLKHPDSKQSKNALCETQTGSFRLTTKERKRILLNNIYGVDIDAQAVEVTKLSLLLKMLEGEIDNADKQAKMFHDRLLPDLGNNIKCGNSLIESDFYAQTDLLEMTDEDHYRVNVFDWHDAFKDIFKQGGFDAVIGNPPYIFARGENFTKDVKQYFYAKYKEQNYQLNTYPIFIEHGINLLKKNGHFGYIVPNNWLTIGTLKHFRDFIISSVGQLNIINYGYKVFDGANVDTSTILFTKTKPTSVNLITSNKAEELQLLKECPYKDLIKNEVINFEFTSNDVSNIISKLNKHQKLGEITNIKCGLKVYQTGKGKPTQTNIQKEKRIFHSQKKANATYGRYLQGVDVKRYILDWSGEWLSYGDWLAEPRRSAPFTGERILVRQIPSKPPLMINACLVSENYYNDINSMIIFNNSIHDVTLRAVLGQLNSKLLSFWFNHTYQKMQRGIFPQFKVNELAQFPISLNSKVNSQITRKVAEINELYEISKTTNDKLIDIKIKALNIQIDKLVYQAFGLTEEEQQLIEDAQYE